MKGIFRGWGRGNKAALIDKVGDAGSGKKGYESKLFIGKGYIMTHSLNGYSFHLSNFEVFGIHIYLYTQHIEVRKRSRQVNVAYEVSLLLC